MIVRVSVKLVIVIGALIVSSFSKVSLDDEAEFVCNKTHKSSNSCYYNFQIGGIPYHYRDVGCKKKKDEIIKGVNEGKYSLAKDWKIPCPEVKKDAKADSTSL